MVKVFIMRYNKGRIPPANLTEEMKRDITKKVGDFLKENPDAKFNGLWVNDESIDICEWETPNAEIVRKAVEGMDSPYDEVVEEKGYAAKTRLSLLFLNAKLILWWCKNI